ncbi:succinate dehydrogenase, cytochrome b556 subunit [Pseudoxanthomonas wuyuanensis]|uniref:Succinate dehydrogenase cytochrome b556 subunit n=1 Tax=Pseudoxanthomonas wuyuanensis TaxID=1073196 RepID=A0A286D8W8_9GAMM|nr:succinate dehydrogenase, cytochrome b556 subunit [Pseudoxanthomonas wuyuanensis]KAF1718900.1 succinate dehydrogenase, cytochrome b556 subunit [Pseudoxanthomonas wuyuanensis]SOD55073.1 succinate dehydrogenase subunit C [Pseudoxanthomonas wuyuanensis]
MATRERPLSPHLQVYRWQIQMATSILHRITGIFLAFGALVIAAGLLTLMMGPEAWTCFSGIAAAWYGQLFLFAWTWAFAYHLCNGIRHIVQDFGHGFSIPAFVRSSWLSVFGSLVITVLVWAYVLAGGGV